MWLHVPSTYLPSAQASEGSSSGSTSLVPAVESSVTWRGKLRHARFWRAAWKKATWLQRLSGLTSAISPSSGSCSNESTSSPLDTPASRTPWPGNERVTRTSAGSGLQSRTPFAYYDHASASLRTSQATLLPGLDTFSGPWPRSGSMRNGEFFQQKAWAPPIAVRASSSWPTPDASVSTGYNQSPSSGAAVRPALGRSVQNWHTPKASADESGNPRENDRQDLQAQGAARSTGLQDSTTPDGPTPSPISGRSSRPPLNPRFAAWLMGFPDAWISCGPTETEWSRWLQQSHSALSRLVPGWRSDGQS